MLFRKIMLRQSGPDKNNVQMFAGIPGTYPNPNTVGSEIQPFGNPQTFKIWSFLKIGIQMVQSLKGWATAMVLTI